VFLEKKEIGKENVFLKILAKNFPKHRREMGMNSDS
jgi:hypothetical protein